MSLNGLETIEGSDIFVFVPISLSPADSDAFMYVCCVAETRHTYPRLERKPAAIPEWDGKCYVIRVPDPAVHSLVPEPYLLRTGLAEPLQGRPSGFQGFVSARLIYWALDVILFVPRPFRLVICCLCNIAYFTHRCWTFAWLIKILFYCLSDSDFISCIV